MARTNLTQHYAALAEKARLEKATEDARLVPPAPPTKQDLRRHQSEDRARKARRKAEREAELAALPPRPIQELIEIKPQPGPQEAFLATPADICLYGGAAGSGKTFSLLLEPLRYINNPLFNCIVFRREGVMVKNPGGLWDESMRLYPLLGGVPKEITMHWKFPSGASIRFAHLEHPGDVHGYQGAQLVACFFDELTHFAESQFVYMLSRLRSLSGIQPYMRMTCNPDSDSWVKRWIDWWIGRDGFPIKERSGVIRHFIQLGGELYWADTPEELKRRFGPETMPLSFTFISAKLDDNQILVKADPNYRAKLLALDRVSRERLLNGNWVVRPSAGMYFRREWFKVVDQVPGHVLKMIRHWDRAATKPSETNRDPDWTVGIKLFKLEGGKWLVADMRRIRDTALKVEQYTKQIAEMDGVGCAVGLEKDPGSAGESDIMNMQRVLAGYLVKIFKPSKDKLTRALPVSAQVEAGNIYVLRGDWNDAFFTELENFPPEDKKGHDDIADSLSGAFNSLSSGSSIFEVL